MHGRLRRAGIGAGWSGVFGGATFTPAAVSGLELWLDASSISGVSDGTAVESFEDRSGKARHATQSTEASRPAYKTGIINSLPALLFASDSLATSSFLDSSYDTAFSIYAVVKQTGAAFKVWAGNNNGKFYGSGSLSATTDSFNTSALTAVSSTVTKLTPRVTSMRYGGATKKMESSGETKTYINHVAATGNLGLSGALTVGDFDQGGFAWDGHIAELLIYKRDLPDAEHRLVDGYLRKKYALNWASLLQLVADGNSLTQGVGATNSYPSQLQTLLGGSAAWDLSNFGVSGQSTTAMLTDYTTQVLSLYGRNRGRNVLLFWEGTNEISAAGEGATGAAALTKTLEYIDASVAQGFEVFALTVLPRTDFDATEETHRGTYNSGLISGADNYTVVDVAADTRLDDFNDLTYYDADGIHLNDAGYAVVASLVADVIA
jgi:lysophospholipase L1-like esterase